MVKKIVIIIGIVLILLIIAVLIFINNSKITPNEDGHIITNFCLSESSSNAMAVGGDDKNYYFSIYKDTLEIETPELGGKITVELDKTERGNLEQELLMLIDKYSIKKWNGYDEWIDTLDDYHSFSLNIKYANEKEINAYGDHIFPDDYRNFFNDVKSIFSKYIN